MINKIGSPAITISQLTKSFSGHPAVNNLTVQVNQGEIFALVGENGAGKTTLIKTMVGLYQPDKGEIKLFNNSIVDQPEKTKACFGYVSDNPTVYDYLTGREFLRLTGRLRKMTKTAVEKKSDELLAIFHLDQLIDQPMADYSRGNRQKVAFLSAILSQPPLLIIDEPIVGLDPDSIDIFGQNLKKFAEQGGTVFFATHILSFAQKWASRAGIIHKGVLKKDIVLSSQTNLEDLYHLTIKL